MRGAWEAWRLTDVCRADLHFAQHVPYSRWHTLVSIHSCFSACSASPRPADRSPDSYVTCRFIIVILHSRHALWRSCGAKGNVFRNFSLCCLQIFFTDHPRVVCLYWKGAIFKII
jgi:hypothetical protein